MNIKNLIHKEEPETICTKIFNSRADGKDFIAKRSMLIEEAIAFEHGNINSQVKTIIAIFDGGKEAYFLKPGKETMRKTPNHHDMLPDVCGNFDRWAFEQIWEYLIKISIIQNAAFKKILTLLYRLCFFVDHQYDRNRKFRYAPSTANLEYINNLEKFVLNDGFQEKFMASEVALLEFLYFVDLLAWNEDVKYHSAMNASDFSNYGSKVGRVNTILTIISAPILISRFINSIVDSAKNNGIIDVKLITTTIQKFTKSRGMCILSNAELLDFLHPYLMK
jgi:hypothetical protein